MISTLLLVATAAPNPTQVAAIRLTPSDDIWVYPHAGDPQRDAFLRVWGRGDSAVGATLADNESYSFSYLRFILPPSLRGQEVTTAVLQLEGVSANFTSEESRKYPIQARIISADFAERGWTFDKSEKIVPSREKDAVVGEGSAETLKEDATYTVELKLRLDHPSVKALWSGIAADGKPIALALTSAIPVEESRKMYKLHSANAERESARPSLVIGYTVR